MFIPLVENLIFPIGDGFLDLAQVAGFDIITFSLGEGCSILVPVKDGITVRAFDMDVYRLMLPAPKEETISE